jgi:transglutaminase-like putative cysteine protease
LAAWAFYRRRRPLSALLPLVALTALSVFYAGQGIWWLSAQLGCGVLVLAFGTLAHAQHAWERAGMDYAVDLGLNLLAVAGIVSLAVVMISTLVPQLSLRQISDRLGRVAEGPSGRVRETAERLFGGVSSPAGPDTGEGLGAAASGYLPQSRLLGGQPDLLEEVVLHVMIEEPAPLAEGASSAEGAPQRRYWRGVTYDRYTGRGWDTTVDSRQEVDGELPLPAPPVYDEIVQRFEFDAPHGDTLYALNAPAWVGQPVEALWRGPGDLAGLASPAVSYTVASRLPAPTADDLQEVPALVSAEVAGLYLQLPEDLPRRVVDLAREVVAEGETTYERARLLERYLRAYPYSLEVDRPPEGRDVADYFLFDAREGYCDYYATAFVVMARAVDIPSRLASGYAGGEVDPVTGSYQVRGLDGHSWPEVYFPGWGWIGFEPTGAREVTELPQELPLPGEALPGPSGPPARVVRSRRRAAVLGGVALIPVGIAVAVVLGYRRRRAARVITLPLVWSWVGRGGARLGVPLDPALTPREYAGVLAAALRARAARARRWRERWTRLAAQGGATLEHLATHYGAQVYGNRRDAADEDPRARELWERLRGPLGWFAVLDRGQRFARRLGLRERKKPGFSPHNASSLACEES